MSDTVQRILMVHESYANRGGEDEVVDSECATLNDRGHKVVRWSVSNSEISGWSAARKASLIWRTTWSRRSYRILRDLITSNSPDVIQASNTVNHTYNAQQIEWFKAGGALNIIRANVKA